MPVTTLCQDEGMFCWTSVPAAGENSQGHSQEPGSPLNCTLSIDLRCIFPQSRAGQLV